MASSMTSGCSNRYSLTILRTASLSRPGVAEDSARLSGMNAAAAAIASSGSNILTVMNGAPSGSTLTLDALV